MTEDSVHSHWDEIYASRNEPDVSWFQDQPAASLDLIEQAAATKDSDIIDIGGGASRLVDGLLERGFRRITVLDISQAALDLSCLRLGRRAGDVKWITADVTQWPPSRRFDIWHDRAAFHFLVDAADRAAYVAHLNEALRPSGYVIIATFAEDGPATCSGLPVKCYDAESLSRELGGAFKLVESRRHAHTTPSNETQQFRFSLFQKRAVA